MPETPVSDSAELNQRIDLGAECAKFINSAVGVYIMRRAQEEERDALEELATHDADDAKGIRELQNQVFRANSFIGWLQEAIQDAVSAHEAVEEQERLQS